MKVRHSVFLGLILLVAIVGFGQNPREGRNKVAVRGQDQDVYFYPAQGGSHGKVLFLPGDGGWRGFAIEIANQMQRAGYDVYGWDTRRYLMSFADTGGLKPSEIGGDFRQIAAWMQRGSKAPVLLVGWSEGAGLGLAAVADPPSKPMFQGLTAIGMTEQNILAWRWSDTWAEIAKKIPHEPTFQSADYIDKVSPLPLFVIASSRDEYVTQEASQRLFNLAKEPKKFAMINANNHNYGGNTDEFFSTLKEALIWIAQPAK